MPLALVALMISAFAIGTTEFVIMGLLPNVATDLHVSIPTAGLLISGYAMGVVVGAPVLTAVTTSMRRKNVLVILMSLFILGSVLSAVAPTYWLLMLGRIVAALCHGAYFGVGSIVAANLVAPNKKAAAIALMFTGLTFANVIGVPMGTVLGQAFGWRSAFWAVTLLGVIGILGVAFLVPSQPVDGNNSLRKEVAAFRRPQVWLAYAVTAIGFSGLLASFTYIAPMMTEVAGYAPESVAWLLVLYGVGLVIGNYVCGKLADRALMPTILVLLVALAVTLAVFSFTAHNKVLAAACLFLSGAFGYGLIPPLQSFVIQLAGGSATLVSAGNIAAFNLGAALGAYLGGVTIDAGFGLTSPNWVGALCTTVGLGLALLSVVVSRRSGEPGVQAAPEQVRDKEVPRTV